LGTDKKGSPSTLVIQGLAIFLIFSTAILIIDKIARISAPSSAHQIETVQAIAVGGRATLGSSLAVPGSVLTVHEIAHMRYMREEEKLAHDVYLLLASQWGTPVFAKIAQAEQRHTDAVLGLLVRYGVPDPSAGAGPGQFTDSGLAALYQTLIQKGTVSLMDALMVGGLIEEVDIADLENAVASTTRPDIIRVYENIHRGSRNHLRSFAGALNQIGMAYQPQKLSTAEVDAILSTPIERGPPL
jgi:hypothetical protein